MPESVIRSISGLVYIGLLVSSILYSSTSYKILFLLFMILASYEFSKMIAISKTHALLLSTLVAGIYLLFPTINFAGWLICIPFLVYLSYKLFAQKTYAYKTMGKKLIYQIAIPLYFTASLFRKPISTKTSIRFLYSYMVQRYFCLYLWKIIRKI